MTKGSMYYIGMPYVVSFNKILKVETQKIYLNIKLGISIPDLLICIESFIFNRVSIIF